MDGVGRLLPCRLLKQCRRLPAAALCFPQLARRAELYPSAMEPGGSNRSLGVRHGRGEITTIGPLASSAALQGMRRASQRFSVDASSDLGV
jgi:hypothetical protein